MQIWHIKMFGSLAVSRDEEDFSRFSTRKTGALLAFLAFHPERHHSREALCDLLWPDEAPQTSRARLRVALTSLRHQLEPPGVSPGSVIRSDGNEQIHLAPGAVSTDVGIVERGLRLLLPIDSPPTSERLAAARQVAASFTQPLLTGFYEDWIVSERERFIQAAVERVSALARQISPEDGLELARYATRLDPLAEEPLFALLPLLAQSGQHGTAQRTFQAFCRRCEEFLGAAPSPKLQALADALPAGREKPAPAAAAAQTVSLPPAVVSETLPEWSRRLPSYLTRFFGRENERREVRTALADTRLLTITGPGGTGKTRLAVETARAWEGNVFFVPLAHIGDPNRIPAALCDALGEKTRTASDSPDALLTRAAAMLTHTPTPLLVLDNLEQVADAAGSSLLQLLERAPGVRLLVTSRLRVHLPGEQAYALGPLPLPSLPSTKTPQAEREKLAEVAQVPSVALFLDRARAARPDFQITERNQSDVLAICQMLEGIPLAIELVAARGGMLVPSQMRAKLSEQGSLLIADRHSEPDARHRSLYTAIDWSYQLLPPDLRRFFASLSTFRGGFTAEAAAFVGNTSPENTNEALARLRAHSLVTTVADADEMRFSLLESLRAFAAEQLTPDEQAAAQDRHAQWFTVLAEQFDTDLSGAQQAVLLERITTDLDNLRAAMEHDLSVNPQRAVQAAGAFWLYWNMRGRPTEGRVWLERALAAGPSPDELGDPASPALVHRGRALHGAGSLANVQGNTAVAQPLFEESLRLRRRIGDKIALSSTLNNMGLMVWAKEDAKAGRVFLEEALLLRREANASVSLLATSLQNLAVMDWEIGDYDASQVAATEALILFRQGENKVGEGHALNNLGNLALALGKFARAEDYYAQSLEIKRSLGYVPGIAMTLSNVGVAAMDQGKYEAATTHFEESLALHRETGSTPGIVLQLRNLGKVAVGQKAWELAFERLSQSLTLERGSDDPDDISGILEVFAQLAIGEGNPERAARLTGAMDAHRVEVVPPSQRLVIDKATNATRAALGEERFEALYHEGTLLSVAEAAALALAR